MRIDPEKLWGLTHPFAAIKIKKISKHCYTIYNDSTLKNKLDNFGNGGKLDAFRHIFFMAAFAQKIKVKKVRKLGIAHEKKNYRQFLQGTLEDLERPDSLGTVMDLENNELAFNLGASNKKVTLTELKSLVIKEINEGKAVIVKRNRKKNYLNCNDEIIDLKLYIKNWYVPKCLVASNYIYRD